ncbi:hypothetical protein EDC01DRAFT_635859 [Geopyxis carbonaria]|nr:hypothetical protein EDC01DRAFT_635859 [Geopyxis carbonaria]
MADKDKFLKAFFKDKHEMDTSSEGDAQVNFSDRENTNRTEILPMNTCNARRRETVSTAPVHVQGLAASSIRYTCTFTTCEKLFDNYKTMRQHYLSNHSLSQSSAELARSVHNNASFHGGALRAGYVADFSNAGPKSVPPASTSNPGPAESTNRCACSFIGCGQLFDSQESMSRHYFFLHSLSQSPTEISTTVTSIGSAQGAPPSAGSVADSHGTATSNIVFPCPFAGCGQVFDTFAKMRRHRDRHSVVEAECPLCPAGSRLWKRVDKLQE